MKTTRIKAADLFCGAGGTSTGLSLAAQELGLGLDLLAINHWEIAIDTHAANHTYAQHLCESLDTVDPRKIVPGGRLKILMASPECTHHSNARGGKPMSDQSRASAWHVLRWAEALTIENILIENVREFRDWGPLGTNGRPLKRRKGETFRAFLTALRSLGYVVEDRILNAANYGDPTTRERLFILAKRGNKQIHWPEPTHSATGEKTLFGAVPKWRAAREVIDWSMKGESIFTRKKPLSPNTMKRIMAGLRKFSGKAFVIGQQSCAAPRDVEQPIPTVAGAGAISFVEPFVVMLNGTNEHAVSHSVRSMDDPLPTVTAQGGHLGMAEPYLVEYHGGRNSERRTRSVNEPLPTQDTSNRFGLAEPFIMQMDMGGRLQSVDQPFNTVTSADARALVEPFIIPTNHGDDQRAHSVDEPMRTITSVDAWALIEPYLVKYYGTGDVSEISEPIPTITGKDRFGIVIPELNNAVLDIRFRMLQPHELAAAMSFPHSYIFSGNREQKVKQIGNAVPVQLARSLCRALLEN